MKRVAVVGARGRLGSVAVRAIADSSDLELVAAIGRGDDLARELSASRAQVLLEVSLPECALDHARLGLAAGVHVVIGASGIAMDALQELGQYAEQRDLGLSWVPNFSIGVALLQRFAREAVRYFPDVEIIEAHHAQKRDAPSATALDTARQLGAIRGRGAREGEASVEAQARGLREAGIPVHAVRLPGLVAEQDVHFGGPGQVLSLRHVTYDREAFAPGMLHCLRRAQDHCGLRIGLDALLDSPSGH